MKSRFASGQHTRTLCSLAPPLKSVPAAVVPAAVVPAATAVVPAATAVVPATTTTAAVVPATTATAAVVPAATASVPTATAAAAMPRGSALEAGARLRAPLLHAAGREHLGGRGPPPCGHVEDDDLRLCGARRVRREQRRGGGG